MKKTVITCWVMLLMVAFCRADEGMWIPMLLKKYNIEDMQQKGFKLTADDVYAINRASLKDAVVGLGREGSPFHHFCTAELISSEGLLVTNHHCAFNMIQAHSSLEHNYLRDGFWARNRSEELANPGITASILIKMEDVTDKIYAYLSEDMPEVRRNTVIDSIAALLEQEAVRGTDYAASVKPYFNGNQFFLSVFRIYKDVRLVAAPPSAIGKFGGDTDNWMWPRHTGDFSVLRIYAGKNNEPAAYAAENRPYRPEYFFKISLKGLQEEDFTMVFGYPGTTEEYLPSYAVRQLVETENPHKIAIRTAKLDIINKAMNSDELLRIKYAAKAAGIANAWKKWQGEAKGLKRLRTIENKEKLENRFREWARQRPRYTGILERYEKLYNDRKNLILASAYANEAGRRGAEIVGFALSVYSSVKNDTRDLAARREQLEKLAASFYKDYDTEVDRAILTEMLRLYNTGLPAKWIPEKVAEAAKSGNYEVYTAGLFGNSFFSSPERFRNFIHKMDHKSVKKIERDPIYELARSVVVFNNLHILPYLKEIETELRQLNRIWLAGLMEMQPEKIFYPDANSTLRVSYGKIGGYSPADAVRFRFYTTLSGIMEKDDPTIYDYNVPQKLRDLYTSGNFGPYTQNGEIPVCFIAGNHTTGGNSGSPVLDAEGHLIGINFDRAWEGVMSDMQYDPTICRNIAVDIRYVLFIMDKLGDAGYLLEEMDIVH